MQPNATARTFTRLVSAILCLFFTAANTMADNTPDMTAPDNLIEKLFAEHPDKFGAVTAGPTRTKLQVLLTIVDDTDPDHPTLIRHGYRLGAEYFYPASSIKTYAAAAALIKLQQLREATGLPLDHKTSLTIHPLFEDEELQDADESNLDNGKITIEHEIRKTLLVSSNSAYNHLFEFVGHEDIHATLADAGLTDTHLNHRLSEFRSPEDNRLSPRFDMTLEDGTVHTIPERKSELITDNAGMPGLHLGKAHYAGGKLINEPLDFTHKNHSSLTDLQDFLIQITRPDVAAAALPDARLPLTDADRAVLLSALSQHPYDSKNPVYTEKDLPEAHGYPHYQYGLERLYPREDLRLYAKSGLAYGFTLENAAVIHKPTGRTFFLTAVLYTNPNETLNDDTYDYDLSDQFLIDLAEAVARELWE